LLLFSILYCTAVCEDDDEASDHPAAVMLLVSVRCLQLSSEMNMSKMNWTSS
jgi:hypothetical protein